MTTAAATRILEPGHHIHALFSPVTTLNDQLFIELFLLQNLVHFAPDQNRNALDEDVARHALEIGAAGFLGGQVVLDDRRVVSVELPRLK